MLAPFGRRLCEVAANEASGGYRVFSRSTTRGPGAGGRAVLHAGRRASAGAGATGAPTCRGPSRSPTPRPTTAACGSTSCRGGRARHRAALRARAGRAASGSTGRWAGRSRRRASSTPGAAGAILVGGGIGVAPLALLRRRARRPRRPDPDPARLPRPRRTPAASTTSSPAARSASPARTATPATAATSPTCSRVLLEGDDAGGAVVYACGPPAMLEAVRAMCARARGRLRAGDGVADGLRLRRLLRLRGAAGRGRLHAALRRRAGRRAARQIETALVAGAGHR